MHDDIALKNGKFTKFEEVPAITKIDLFNQTLAVQKKTEIQKWHKNYKKFLKRFPMFKNEPKMTDAIQVFDIVAYKDRMVEQCQNLPESPFLVQNKTLKCQNLHQNFPHLRLGPIKLETLSEHPTVAMFHDFVTDKECEMMKNKGRNKMKATPLTVPKGKNIYLYLPKAFYKNVPNFFNARC